MRKVLTKVFAVCFAAAGLILAVPYAQAADPPPPSLAPTTYYNLTGQDVGGVYTPGYDQAFIQGTSPLLPGPGPGPVRFDAGANAVTVGTGVIDPFVRIQNDGGEVAPCYDPCIESGYNTNSVLVEFETKDGNGGSDWTRAIKLTDVGTELFDGVTYRTFILDINESNNYPDYYLSLDKFQLYLSASDDLTGFCETRPDGIGTDADCFNKGFDTTKNPLVWSMDTELSDATVGLNYDLNSGSGSGIDLYVRVPDALFTAQISNVEGGDLNPWVYLYSSFGATGVLNQGATAPCSTVSTVGSPAEWVASGNPPNTCPAGYLPAGNYGQNSGFEEWASLKGVPEPMSMALLLVGLAAIGFVRRQQPSPIAC